MDEYLGICKLFAGTRVPERYLACDGSLLQIMQNQALFSILGTNFGGNGQTTFALPKLDAPEGLRYIVCVDGVYPSPRG